MESIQDIKIGKKVQNAKNGKGLISNKTTRTITVTFENGNVVKNTYPSKDSNFYASDF